MSLKLTLKKNHSFLVAEIGWNFLGNISLAKKLILSAKRNGADAVKFQIWNPKNLKNRDFSFFLFLFQETEKSVCPRNI